MDLYFIFKAIVIAIVEGVTEFIPVSSTGHMILAGDIIGFPENEFTRMFNVVIQLGAILAIVVLYWNKLFTMAKSFFRREEKGLNFGIALIIGVLPAAVLGFLFEDFIDAYLFKSLPVIIGLFVGAVCPDPLRPSWGAGSTDWIPRSLRSIPSSWPYRS